MSFIKFYRYKIFKCNAGRRFMQVMILFESRSDRIEKDVRDRMTGCLGYKLIDTREDIPERWIWMIFSCPGCSVPSFETLYEDRQLVDSILDVREAGTA